MHKIEKNIPICEDGRYGKWKRLASDMGIGDSVLLNSQAEVSGLYYAFDSAGCKMVQRKTDDGQFRCWRVK